MKVKGRWVYNSNTSTIIGEFMTLKSGNEQLKRVSKKIDALIEDIRQELLARDDASTPLTQDEIDEIIKGKLKYIANPLKNFNINGDT